MEGGAWRVEGTGWRVAGGSGARWKGWELEGAGCRVGGGERRVQDCLNSMAWRVEGGGWNLGPASWASWPPSGGSGPTSIKALGSGLRARARRRAQGSGPTSITARRRAQGQPPERDGLHQAALRAMLLSQAPEPLRAKLPSHLGQSSRATQGQSGASLERARASS